MNKRIRLYFETAFTLFEVMVALIIVGIIAAIGIPKYYDFVECAYCNNARKYLLDVLSLHRTRPAPSNYKLTLRANRQIYCTNGGINSTLCKKMGY